MNAVRLINLTPHVVDVYNGGDHQFSVAPSGVIVRVTFDRSGTTEIDTDHGPIEINITRPVGVENLPDLAEDTLYIVSRLVADIMQDPRLIVPDDLVREDGGVIGCRRFAVSIRQDSGGAPEPPNDRILR